MRRQGKPTGVPASGQGCVETFPGKGVRVVGATHNPGRHKRAKRKAILQWSAGSRRRMRLALLTLGPPEGWHVYGLTLTVPGPVLPLADARALWRDYCRETERRGIGLLWRVEIQQRGQLHWHGIAIGETPIAGAFLRVLWFDALRRLPPISGYDCNKGNDEYSGPRSAVPGAEKYAVKIECGEAQRGAWLRYIADHASKAKQEQIPEAIGRHWGIVGRRWWVRQEPEETHDLPPGAWARYLRAVQRLSTPSRKAPGKPFGRKLRKRNTRGRYGSSVWFGNHETHARAVAWARGESGGPPAPAMRPGA